MLPRTRKHCFAWLTQERQLKIRHTSLGQTENQMSCLVNHNMLDWKRFPCRTSCRALRQMADMQHQFKTVLYKPTWFCRQRLWHLCKQKLLKRARWRLDTKGTFTSRPSQSMCYPYFHRKITHSQGTGDTPIAQYATLTNECDEHQQNRSCSPLLKFITLQIVCL